MEAVVVVAQELSIARQTMNPTLIARTKRLYDLAVREYTNPFGTKKGTTA